MIERKGKEEILKEGRMCERKEGKRVLLHDDERETERVCVCVCRM